MDVVSNVTPFSSVDRIDSKYFKGDYAALVLLNRDLKNALLECKRTECTYE